MSKNYRAELVGLFGDPVDGNPTGVMEEAGFAAKGLNFRYITARVLPEDLPAAFELVRSEKYGETIVDFVYYNRENIAQD